MLYTTLLTLLSNLPFLIPSASSQLIKADHHSFGGVNYPLLQYFTPQHRDATIQAIVKTKARVIRLFIRPDSHHTDPEPQLGEFDKSLLDQLDDTLAAIHHVSKGQIKVIIAPHDAHALRGSNDVPCDAYCEEIGGAFLDFYSSEAMRKIYKTRLDVFFRHYPSKNFGGRSWSELSEVIMGVDIQNQPFSDIWPIPAGESWLCEIATHLHSTIGLGRSRIAVISGGVSGVQSRGGIQNIPDSVFDCPGIDVIGIHGRFAPAEDATPGTPWAELFVPGNTLTARAQARRKLLLVEDWEYVPTDAGVEHKAGDIFDQGNALNVRGIPWIYSYLSSKPSNTSTSTSTSINPLLTPHAPLTALTALTDILSRASTARSTFTWSAFVPAPARLTALTHIPPNPYQPAHAFGSAGALCDAPDACDPDLVCLNDICTRNAPTQPGKPGVTCTSKQRCQPHLTCARGKCQPCTALPSSNTLPPTDPRGTCLPPTHALFLSTPAPCLAPSTSHPCTTPAHCSGTHFCSWGTCVPCQPGDACLGAPCKRSAACTTGFCNRHGRCDWAGQKEVVFGPGVRGRWKGRVDGVPQGWERGAARTRAEALRVDIKEEGVVRTGVPVVGGQS